jgi:hypothetical protein
MQELQTMQEVLYIEDVDQAAALLSPNALRCSS